MLRNACINLTTSVPQHYAPPSHKTVNFPHNFNTTHTAQNQHTHEPPYTTCPSPLTKTPPPFTKNPPKTPKQCDISQIGKFRIPQKHPSISSLKSHPPPRGTLLPKKSPPRARQQQLKLGVIWLRPAAQLGGFAHLNQGV